MSSVESNLKKIEGWNFISDDPSKVNPIYLCCDVGIETLKGVSKKYNVPVMLDGDIIPGKCTLIVLSEPMARNLIMDHRATVVDPGEVCSENRGFVYTSVL